MSNRFRHKKWNADIKPGDILEGVWFQAPRPMPRGGWLGEVEHDAGTRTGFTIPTMLREQLRGLALGTYLRIKYLGTETTSNGYEMMQFAVWRRPPQPQQ